MKTLETLKALQNKHFTLLKEMSESQKSLIGKELRDSWEQEDKMKKDFLNKEFEMLKLL